MLDSAARPVGHAGRPPTGCDKTHSLPMEAREASRGTRRAVRAGAPTGPPQVGTGPDPLKHVPAPCVQEEAMPPGRR